MSVRTGRVIMLSAARLAGMTATRLPENDPSPEIAGQLRDFLSSRHGLVEIGEELSERTDSRHGTLQFATRHKMAGRQTKLLSHSTPDVVSCAGFGPSRSSEMYRSAPRLARCASSTSASSCFRASSRLSDIASATSLRAAPRGKETRSFPTSQSEVCGRRRRLPRRAAPRRARLPTRWAINLERRRIRFERP